MNYRNIIKVLIQSALFAYMLVFLSVLTVDAEEIPKITIYPSKENISISAGKNVKKSVMIVNEGDKPVALKVSIHDFRVVDAKGKIEFYESESYPAKKWLVPQYDVITIPKISSKKMEYIVVTPKDMPGKGYAGAIAFEVYNPTNKQTIGDPFGTQVRLNVISEGITTGGTMESFTNPFFQFDDPMDISFAIKNTSNSNLALSGNVVFTDIFGKEVGNFKTGQLDVFPGSERNFTFQWSDSPAFGIYFATANLVDALRSDNMISSSSMVIFLPWQKLLLLGLFIVLIAAIVFAYRLYTEGGKNSFAGKMAFRTQKYLQPALTMGLSFKKMMSGLFLKVKGVKR